MNIVIHLVYTLHGGIASVAANLIRQQHSMGYKNYVAYVEGPNVLAEMLGFEIEFIRLPVPKFPGQTMLFGTCLRKVYFDIKKKYPDAKICIHAHSLQTVGCLSRIKNIPIVCTMHGIMGVNPGHRTEISNFLARKTIRKLSKNKSIIVSVSNAVRKSFGNLSDKIKTIYNGVPQPVPETAHNADNVFTIGHIGNISLEKGFDVVAKAFMALPDEIKKQCRFIFAGNIHDITEDYIQMLTENHPAEYKGFVNNAGAVLVPLLDVLVLASRNEGLPMCVIEAMACGVPAIGTNIGGIPEIIKDGENGYIISSCNELEQKLEFMFKEKTLYQKLSQNAYTTYRIHFSDIEMNRAYIDAYNEAIAATKER